MRAGMALSFATGMKIDNLGNGVTVQTGNLAVVEPDQLQTLLEDRFHVADAQLIVGVLDADVGIPSELTLKLALVLSVPAHAH